MPLAPEEDLSAAEALTRAALNALRGGAGRQTWDEGRGTGDAGLEENAEAAYSGDEEAEKKSPSAAENLDRVEERRQREWLYRGHRRTRGGWKRD